MTVREILRVGNDLLYRKAQPITTFDESVHVLMEDLRDTLEDIIRRKNLGRGIAAPQISQSKQAAYVIENGEHMAFVNPVITKRSEEKIYVWDSCFSYDLEIFVLVERAKTIEMSYNDLDGAPKTIRFTGPLSELLQHETDHLNGILSYQRIAEPKRIMWRNEWEAHGSPYIVDWPER